MKSILDFFSSVKLAIVLLIIITLASILGTLIPQHRSAAEYAARYGQFSNVLIQLEITRLYHSLWFIALLFLFALNTVVCTLTRLSPKLKRALHPKVETEKKRLQALKFKGNIFRSGDLNQAKATSLKILRSKHYRIKEASRDKTVFLLARKKIFGFFGSDIVHLGLLIILLGGIFSGFGGNKEILTFSEGEVQSIADAGFSLRLDKFETEFWPNGSVRDWKSTLTVMENGADQFYKIIEVNHPLSYKGYVFYQSNYGWDWEKPTMEIWTRKKSDPDYLEKNTLQVGQKVMLSDQQTEILAKHFIPDFIIGEGNQITTRSMNPNNPAALIEGWQGEEKVFASWAFSRYPDFSQMHEGADTDYVIEFKDFSAAQYSGIQMSHDPGVNLIWAGCALLMLGLLVAFFWPPREIRLLLEEDGGKTEINIGAIAAKNKDTFQPEFEGIIDALRSQ